MSLHSHARNAGGALGSMPPRATLQPPAGAVRPVLRIMSEDFHHVTFTWGPLLGTLWKMETLVPSVTELKTILQSLATTIPGKKVGVLTIVAADARLPSSEARDALLEVFHESADSVVCSAVVFEGSGFRASAVRSVATGLALLARQPFPHRIFSNTKLAFRWADTELREQSGIAIDVAQLERDFAALRSTSAM